MLKQIEGSCAVAEAVAMCRPQVICAYPITPQTHIVEALSAMVKKEELAAEFLNVESEFAAMSVVIGASAASTRAYTATASQGLLYMSEAVWNAAGLGLPIVMTVANRAIGAPIKVTSSTPIRHQVPVTDYLRIQARYAHLFKPEEKTEVIGRIQATADRNIRRFGLAGLDTERAEVAEPGKE